MRRTLVGLLAVGLLIGLTVGPVAAASGGVARYQATTTDYTVSVLNTYIHDYVVVTNPCDGTMTVTSAQTQLNSGYYTTENVVFTVAGGVFSYTSTYLGPYNTGYSYSGSFNMAASLGAGGTPLSGSYTGTVTAVATTTNYNNHGDYVSSMGGGADAAHSCLGMPIVTQP